MHSFSAVAYLKHKHEMPGVGTGNDISGMTSLALFSHQVLVINILAKTEKEGTERKTRAEEGGNGSECSVFNCFYSGHQMGELRDNCTVDV